VLALGFLMRYLRREIKWRSSVFNFGLLFLTLLISGILFVRYYQFVRNMLLFSPFDPIDFSLLQMDPVKMSQVFGMLWLDLAFVLLIALFYAIVMKNIPRTTKNYLIFAGMEA